MRCVVALLGRPTTHLFVVVKIGIYFKAFPLSNVHPRRNLSLHYSNHIKKEKEEKRKFIVKLARVVGIFLLTQQSSDTIWICGHQL